MTKAGGNIKISKNKYDYGQYIVINKYRPFESW